MSKINIESEKQLLILEALARYKFLTISQMIQLDLAGEKKHKTYLNTLLKKMRERKRPTISCIKFAGTHKFQQREYVYYLTKYGANDLILNTGINSSQINRPIGTSSMYERDYSHRKCYIDVKISLHQWADKNEIDVILYDNYYDYLGSSHGGTLRAKTSIALGDTKEGRIIPDGIFILDNYGSPKLYAIEIHMGRDTLRAMRQIMNHKIALDTGAISTHYGLEVGNRVLYVFENKNIMERVIQGVKDNRSISEAYYPYFLFAFNPDLRLNFNNWFSLNSRSDLTSTGIFDIS